MTLAERIRRARTIAKMSQQTLAAAVGVQRSAVAQWERRDGNHPSMHHLADIASVTGVHLEWLGTGRGPAKPELDAWIPAVRSDDFAQDELESECLTALRKMPLRVRESVVSIIKLVSKNY